MRTALNDIQSVEVPHRRDDTEIAEAAVHALRWDPLVPDDRIRVSVEHGLARLEGTVEWDYQREAAEKAVRNLAGVTDLTNLVVIEPGGCRKCGKCRAKAPSTSCG